MVSFLYINLLQDETQGLISDLREGIARLRNKIAQSSESNKEDVLKLEVCVCLSGCLSQKEINITNSSLSVSPICVEMIMICCCYLWIDTDGFYICK